MPALIRELALSGSRKSDGTANASGKVFLYVPGTTTVTPGYKDDSLSEAWTTSGGGIPLDAGGRVKIWINDMVDVVVSDTDGATVDTMLGYNKTRAEQVEVENDSFTGALADSSGAVSQDLGGKTDLDMLLTRAATSLGDDFKYQESASAISQPYIEVIRQIHITPQNFGALGNGVHDDTAAINNAITELTRLGGGTLYFSPGAYISSGHTLGSALANASGITFLGAGSQATTIKSNSAGLFFIYASAFRMKGMTLTHATSTSTGDLVTLQNAVGVLMEDIVTDGKYRRVLRLNACSNITVRDSKLVAVDGDAAAYAVVGGTVARLSLAECDIQGGSTGTAISCDAGSSSWLVAGNKFSNSAIGIRYTDDIVTPGTNVPTGINVIGNPTLGSLATPILPLGTAIGGGLFASSAIGSSRQLGNGVEGSTTSITSGGSFTPEPFAKGLYQRVVGTTTGVAYTIAAPNYVPTIRGWQFVLQCVNAAGGAVTGWTFAAGYKTNGAVNTDAHTTSLTFEYDLDATKWREIARADTVT